MNKPKYSLREVVREDKRLVREFLDLPKSIYKGNPSWVCPFDDSIESVFDPSRNKLFADGEAIRWVAYDSSGRAVGRIAAFYDREHAYSYEQPTGGCGFFEAIDDQQLADMMFDAARDWLAQRGMEAMDGPVNFGGGVFWSRDTSSSRCTRIPTTRPTTRRCSRITVSRTTSTRIHISGNVTTTRSTTWYTTVSND